MGSRRELLFFFSFVSFSLSCVFFFVSPFVGDIAFERCILYSINHSFLGRFVLFFVLDFDFQQVFRSFV